MTTVSSAKKQEGPSITARKPNYNKNNSARCGTELIYKVLVQEDDRGKNNNKLRRGKGRINAETIQEERCRTTRHLEVYCLSAQASRW
ncbi:hypothetical protein ACROYT_G011983 [Oculina patagonica]